MSPSIQPCGQPSSQPFRSSNNTSTHTTCDAAMPTPPAAAPAAFARAVQRRWPDMSAQLVFRDTRVTDIDALFEVRANTRQNPLTRADLASLGITPDSTAQAFESGTIVGSVCTCEDRGVG